VRFPKSVLILFLSTLYYLRDVSFGPLIRVRSHAKSVLSSFLLRDQTSVANFFSSSPSKLDADKDVKRRSILSSSFLVRAAPVGRIFRHVRKKDARGQERLKDELKVTQKNCNKV
jgi:hypothetical protein